MSNEHEEVEVVETEEVEVAEEESNETEAEVEPTAEEVRGVKTTETLEDKKARLERQLAQTNKKLGIEVKKPLASKESAGGEKSLSPKDLLALVKADVHEDDMEEVLEYAKFKKLDVSDALKTGVVKTMLAEKTEFRKTSQVMNTGAGRKSSTKVSDETLLSNLNKGVIPEKGGDEAERLFWARRGGKRS